MKDYTSLTRGSKWILAIGLAIFPLFFLPVTQDYYDTNKWMLLVTIALFAFTLWAYHGFKRSLLTISWSPASLGLAGMTVASLISLIISSPNKTEALISPFGLVTFAALTLIMCIVPPLFDIPSRRRLLWLFYGTTAVLSLCAIYQFFGMGKTMFPSVSYLADPLWTPTGATMATLTIAILMLPIVLSHSIAAWKAKSELTAGVLILTTIIILCAVALTIYQLVPRLSIGFLPLREGWTILLEILKAPKQALAGVGADNFLTAFSAGRPASMNLLPIWNVRFTTNATMFFHFATIYGLLGAGACILLAKSFIPKAKNTFRISLILGLLSLFLVPPNLSLITVLTVLLVLSHDPKQVKEISIPHLNRGVRIILFLVAGAAIIACIVLAGISYRAEYLFYQSLLRAQDNNGTATYNLQIAAIQTNPAVSRFHLTYSQTNLALATSLASSIAGAGQIGEEAKAQQTKDRDLIAQLVQQAIREAKIGVSQNTYNVLAWENLARTYGQLVGVAQGADNWTVTSYEEAIRHDPTNPVLPLELGIIYVRTQSYTNAIAQFQRSIALKPNFANAYYNLANAYKLNKDNTQAVTAMEQAGELVDPTSSDYTIITKELDDLRTNTPAIPMAPTPAPLVVPPLNLPAGTGL